MKKIFLSVTLLMVFAIITFSQSRGIMESRQAASENLDVFNGTIIGDSSLNVMKELVQKQNALIEADRVVIDQYLDSVKNAADSLKSATINLTADQEMLTKERDINKGLLFYCAIGGGVLFLLLVLFIILFIITSAKKKKYKRQLDDVEKIKLANQKEIELTRQEVESMKAAAKKEIALAKEEINKEAKNAQARIDALTAEKSSLEKKANDKAFEFAQIQQRLSTIKEEYEKKLADANTLNAEITKEKLILEKQIFDKDIDRDNVKKERDEALSNLTNFKTLLERESQERRTMQEKLEEKENEMRNLSPLNNDEAVELKREIDKLCNDVVALSEFKKLYEKEVEENKILEERLYDLENQRKENAPTENDEIHVLRSDNKKLREDMERLTVRLDKEIEGRTQIEEELRKFIEELRNIRNLK